RPPSLNSMIKSNIADGIMPDARAERTLKVKSADSSQTPVSDLTARHPTAILLFELIAIEWILEIVGEIRKQIEPVTKQVCCRTRCRVRSGPLPVRRHAVPECVTVV